jgi:RNA recognition motif-containing protein
MEEITPGNTLYVRNLHEKIKLVINPTLNSIQETLIKSLTLIFSPYGKILDLQCKRHFRIRGQAFIVFETIESATKALSEVNGFPLFSKPMVPPLLISRTCNLQNKRATSRSRIKPHSKNSRRSARSNKRKRERRAILPRLPNASKRERQMNSHRQTRFCFYKACRGMLGPAIRSWTCFLSLRFGLSRFICRDM